MNEATEFQATTKRGEEAPRLAVRAEKRAAKSEKIIVLFSETETAKQNQKFPFHFFFRFAAEGSGEEPCKEMEGSFWVCPRESASAAGARWQARGAYEKLSSHHARGACEVSRFAIGNKLEQRI